MSPETPPPVRRIFTALLVLGVSGAGKTSLLATFADYLWEVHRRVLLLYSWDGGAITTEIQRRMKAGTIRFWRARTRSAPGLALETLALATKGYWPRLIDPTTGETNPAVDLVSPITTKYSLACPQGHPLKVVPSASLIGPTFCSVCKTMIPKEQIATTEAVLRTKGFELVGGVAFDGLTSMTQVVMDDMDRMRGHGHIGGEKSSFGGVITSGSQKFGGNNRADVGFSQTRAQQYVANSLTIPFLVESPVFTGLSTEGSDKGGLTIVGCDLPGQAALTQVPQWFGNIVEADSLIDDDGKKHFVLRLMPFTDKEGRRHLLKTSASPLGAMPEALIDPPVDTKHPFVEFNLGKYFRKLDEDLARAMAEDIPGAPGLPVGLMEYGETSQIEMPTAATMPAAPTLSEPAKGPAAPLPSAAPARAPVAPRPIARPRAKVNAAIVTGGGGRAPESPAGPFVTGTGGSGGPNGPGTGPASTTISPPPPGMKPPQRMEP